MNGNQIDGILIYGNTLDVVNNIVIDHCSVQWAVDENGEGWSNCTDFTYQWCIFAEGALWGHEKGPHNMGMIIGGGGLAGEEKRVSVHHSLFAHNGGRNPLVSRGAIRPPVRIDIRNNVIYNARGAQGPMEFAVLDGTSASPKILANVVNNLIIPGESTGGSFALNGALGHVKGNLQLYLSGNYRPKFESGSPDDWNRGIVDMAPYVAGGAIQWAEKSTYGSDTEFKYAPVVTTPTDKVLRVVLDHVGATRPRRDSVDARIATEVETRAGQSGPGAGLQKTDTLYPVLKTGPTPADGDGDGLPDAWEVSHDLNPDDGSDGARTSFNGYTHIENYINELAGDPVFTNIEN